MTKPLLFLLFCVFSSFGLKAQEEESIETRNDSIRIPFVGKLLPFNPNSAAPAGSVNDLPDQFSLLRSASVQPAYSMPGLSAYPAPRRPVYPGLGDVKNYGGTIGKWYYKQQLGINYGAFVSQQTGYSFSSSELGVGVNILLHYRLTEQLQLLMWGQYFQLPDNKDPVLRLPFLFNQSSIGSALQYTPGEKSKFQLGVEYEYDPADKSWKAESGGKVKLKF